MSFSANKALAAPVALARSQNIALVPNPGGRTNNGGTMPTTFSGAGVPTGWTPSFTNVAPDLVGGIGDATIANPIAGYDTVVLVGMCDISTFLASATFKSRIEAHVSGGGKLIIWDSECSTTNYSNFVYPFQTNNPGGRGASGTLVDVEENTLSSLVPTNASYVNDGAVSTGTDAVGDSNVFVSFNQNWCVDLSAINANQVSGPVQTYARLGSGLIIYNGLDKDAMQSSATVDPASTQGSVHLHRIWMLQLLQPFAPDNLPCGVKVFGLALSPKTATNPVGTGHTVTAHVSTNGTGTGGVTVTFTVTAGPNIGTTGTAVTNTSGDATFTYTSNGTPGTDQIAATATVSGNDEVRTLISDKAEKTWTGGGNTPQRAILTATSPACGQLVVNATGVTPGLPHQIVIAPSAGGTPQLVDVTAQASGNVSATVTDPAGTYFVFVRMTSNQVTVSNTAIVTVAACATPAPTPTPTPIPTPAPTPTPTPTPQAIGRLPSTSTGDGGLGTGPLVLGLLALGAIAWRKRAARA